MDADGMVPSPLAGEFILTCLGMASSTRRVASNVLPFEVPIWEGVFLTMQGFKVQTGGQNGKQSR